MKDKISESIISIDDRNYHHLFSPCLLRLSPTSHPSIIPCHSDRLSDFVLLFLPFSPSLPFPLRIFIFYPIIEEELINLIFHQIQKKWEEWRFNERIFGWSNEYDILRDWRTRRVEEKVKKIRWSLARVAGPRGCIVAIFDFRDFFGGSVRRLGCDWLVRAENLITWSPLFPQKSSPSFLN